MPDTQPTVPVDVESPPPAARPEARDADEARVTLGRLADALSRRRDSRFLLEYLRLRRLLRM